jgi:hypothetical protein
MIKHISFHFGSQTYLTHKDKKQPNLSKRLFQDDAKEVHTMRVVNGGHELFKNGFTVKKR